MAIRLTSSGTLSDTTLQSVSGSQRSATAPHEPLVILVASGGRLEIEGDTAEDLKNIGRQILEIAHNFGAR